MLARLDLIDTCDEGDSAVADADIVPESVAGKVALVAGGGSGIGEAISRRLAAEGGSVAVLDLNEQNGRRVVGGVRNGGAARPASSTATSQTRKQCRLLSRRCGRARSARSRGQQRWRRRRQCFLSPITPRDLAPPDRDDLSSAFYCMRAEIQSWSRTAVGRS